MSSLQAYQLLVNAAKLYQAERETFSKEEIIRKINQIKYLSEQKNVPVMDIKKEILHLQNKFGYLGELEKRFNQQRKSESVKVNALKKEITELKKKLALAKEKDLHKKVEKLSFMLGEILAKQGSKIDVELSKKVVEEIKKDRKLPFFPVVKIDRKMLTKMEELKLVNSLRKKLKDLKEEMSLNSGSPEKIQLLQNKIDLIERKLEPYYQKYPEFEFDVPRVEVEIQKNIQATNIEIKHDVLFDRKLPERFVSKNELPLPPQPKRRRE